MIVKITQGVVPPPKSGDVRRNEDGRFEGSVRINWWNWRNLGILLRACLHPFNFSQAANVALIDRAAKRDGRRYQRIQGEDGNVSIIFEGHPDFKE